MLFLNIHNQITYWKTETYFASDQTSICKYEFALLFFFSSSIFFFCHSYKLLAHHLANGATNQIYIRWCAVQCTNWNISIINISSLCYVESVCFSYFFSLEFFLSLFLFFFFNICKSIQMSMTFRQTISIILWRTWAYKQNNNNNDNIKKRRKRKEKNLKSMEIEKNIALGFHLCFCFYDQRN